MPIDTNSFPFTATSTRSGTFLVGSSPNFNGASTYKDQYLTYHMLVPIVDRLERYSNSDEKNGLFFGDPAFTRNLTWMSRSNSYLQATHYCFMWICLVMHIFISKTTSTTTKERPAMRSTCTRCWLRALYMVEEPSDLQN